MRSVAEGIRNGVRIYSLLAQVLGVQNVADVVRHGRVRWFGHWSVGVWMIGY